MAEFNREEIEEFRKIVLDFREHETKGILIVHDAIGARWSKLYNLKSRDAYERAEMEALWSILMLVNVYDELGCADDSLQSYIEDFIEEDDV